MITVVVSHADPASLNVRDALLALAPWQGDGDLDGLPVRDGPGALRMVEIAGLHLDADGLDRRLHEAGAPVGALVFASKHRSAAARPSLTVHPVGNWGAAEHGGRPGAFSPAPAPLMAALLRALAARAPKGVEATYESTHHGPLVGAPACFLEIGSAEPAWRDPANGRLVAEALLAAAAAPLPDAPVLLGVGGGHYAPKATDLARRGRAAFAHMLPQHAFPAADAATVARAVAASPGATGYFLDPRAEAEAGPVVAALAAAGLPRWVP